MANLRIVLAQKGFFFFKSFEAGQYSLDFFSLMKKGSYVVKHRDMLLILSKTTRTTLFKVKTILFCLDIAFYCSFFFIDVARLA